MSSDEDDFSSDYDAPIIKGSSQSLDNLLGKLNAKELLNIFYLHIEPKTQKARNTDPDEKKGWSSRLIIGPITVQIKEILVSGNNFIVDYSFDNLLYTKQYAENFFIFKEEWEEEIANNIQETFGREELFLANTGDEWHITIKKINLNIMSNFAKLTFFAAVKFSIIYVGDILPHGREYNRAEENFDKIEATRRRK